jgi:hypothetical protein
VLADGSLHAPEHAALVFAELTEHVPSAAQSALVVAAVSVSVLCDVDGETVFEQTPAVVYRSSFTLIQLLLMFFDASV